MMQIAKTFEYRRKQYRAVASDADAKVIVLQAIEPKSTPTGNGGNGGNGNGGSTPKKKAAEPKAPLTRDQKPRVNKHGIGENRQTRFEVETAAREKMETTKADYLIMKETKEVETDKRVELYRAYHFCKEADRGAAKYAAMTIEKVLKYRKPKEVANVKAQPGEKKSSSPAKKTKDKAGSKKKASNQKKKTKGGK